MLKRFFLLNKHGDVFARFTWLAVAYQVHHIRNLEISLMPNTHEIIKIFEI